MQRELNEMVMLREELSQTGMWRAGELVGRAERLLADALTVIEASQEGREVTRLQAVIRHAIPHQTNQEVQRWLELALLPGTPILDNQGRRIDQTP